MTVLRFGDIREITTSTGTELRLVVSSDFHLTAQGDVVLTVLCYPAELLPDVWRSVPVEFPPDRGGPQRALLDRVFTVGRERVREKRGGLGAEAAADARSALARIFLG